MLIVDSQVHIWGADTPERPWPPERKNQAQKPYPVTGDMLLEAMNEAGVDRAILVPPSWEGDRNDLVLEAARLHPDRFAAMGRLSLLDSRGRDLLPHWREQPGMLGLRFTFHTEHQRPWLTDGTADWLWPAAEKAQVPLMIFPPGSLDAVESIAARHPGLKLTIDHLALWGSDRDEPAFRDLPRLVALARLPNVAVKASGLPCYTTQSYPFPLLHDYIRQVYDAFGPRRVFWGTDWTRLPCPYRDVIALFTEELTWLPAADKELIMGRALCDWLGWPAE